MLEIKNFRGAFDCTYEEPTQKELLFLFNHLHEIEKYFSSYDEQMCDFCGERTGQSSYCFPTESITDISEDCWNAGERGIQVVKCHNCQLWYAIDY